MEREKFIGHGSGIDEDERALEAARFQHQHELPELEGLNKRVRWASIVRHETVSAVLASDDDDIDAARVLEAAREITWSGWWLDNLGWQESHRHGYGPRKFAQLIIAGVVVQQERDKRIAAAHSDPSFWSY